jgi:dTDP-4-amino-4,6-dideoxygalactose transaminase
MNRDASELAILGHPSAFDTPLHVGRPNVGDRDALMARINEMLDRRWFSNSGPLVNEFERRVAEFVGTKHCISMCNATVALEIAIRALELSGEVIVPAYTFVATAHALQWQQIKPIFCDMLPGSHNLDPSKLESLITPLTSGIIGVHVWGRPCDVDAIQSVASKHGLKILYDAAHAFGTSHNGKMIGNFGACEVFSFHATKFLNSFEGGAIVTNDDALAAKLRLMRNFGFSGYDRVVFLGINGKMTEVCAAMGLTSLDAIDELVAINLRNYRLYQEAFRGLRGLTLAEYSESDRCNYQYIVVEIDSELAPLNRDELVAVLHAENVLARKYFWPGCHNMEPYRSSQPGIAGRLPVTEMIAGRVLVLPTGQSVGHEQIARIAEIVRSAFSKSKAVRAKLAERPLAETLA